MSLIMSDFLVVESGLTSIGIPRLECAGRAEATSTDPRERLISHISLLVSDDRVIPRRSTADEAGNTGSLRLREEVAGK